MMADFKDELHCPICLDIFTDPVTLVCGHNFCWMCINQVLRRKVSGVYMCPQCRKRFRSRPVLNKNTNLSNIAEQFRITTLSSVPCTYCDLLTPAIKTCLQCETSMCERHLQYHNRSVQHNLIASTPALEEKKCPIHNKIRGYYCRVDATCICVSCCLSKEHRGLQVEPLNKAYEKKKKRLQDLLKALNSKTGETESKILNLKLNITKVQGIEDVDQEETRTSSILSKREWILLSLTNQIQELEEENQDLKLKKRRVEDLCLMIDPITVLQELVIDECTDNDGDTLYASGLDTRMVPGTLHKCLLTPKAERWWFPMQKPADLSLDVNTAANGLHVSDNRKAVICSVINQAHPETSVRFKRNQILSFEMFSTGRHYWDVESSQQGDWMIGVCYPSMDKGGKKSFLGCNTKSWCLRRCHNEFWLQHNNRCLYLPHMTSCNTVRVSLDYEAGHLSFHDLGSPIRHLHTYKVIFTEPLFAGFTLFSGWLQMKNSEDTLQTI